MNPTDTSAEPIDNPLSAMQDDEVLVCQIKRHPIGLLGIYLTAGSVLIVIAVLVGLRDCR
jgi:urocanate hydratase